jgi:glutamate-1-semialdehyde 2,1-aminomutase
MNNERSHELFARAQRTLVGGVNSPVRAFRSVGGNPVYMTAGEGAWMTDADGNRYLDYVGSWGPLIVGHSHPAVVAALHEAIARGTSFGTCSAPEVELAEKVKEFFPSLEKIRFVNSGTEATMGAIRLARGATGCDKIVKFAGCYHGHGDAFLVKAGSGALTFGAPDSAGVPASVAQETLTARFNDLPNVAELFDNNAGRIAAVIVEPVVGNMGVVPPAPDFLAGLRQLCDAHGALLIFDEVMTGFRVARGGAQALYGVRPDLTTLGKIIGGGLPVGAFGGLAKIMDLLSPLGPVYQAGTLSGNPLAMAAGLATLKLLTPDLYAALEAKSARLADGLARAAAAAGVAAQVNRVGSMLTLFFTDRAVTDLESAQTTDTKRFAAFFREMLDAGVYLPPSNYEAWFVSAAHSDDDIEVTIRAAERALRGVYQAQL